MTSTEIAVRDTAAVTERDVIDGWITVVGDVAKLADYIAETDFVPRALRNRPAAIAACILTGRELGIGPMASLKSIHMVQGVPSLSAEYKRARALAAGHQIVIDETNSTRCVARGRRAGAENWLTITWTMDHAKRAKLDGKDVWKQYPQRMLQARATGELCDLLFPDATLGLATTEELEDGGVIVAAEMVTGVVEPGEQAAAIEPPKPAAAARTAKRRTPATTTPSAPAAAVPDGQPASGPSAAAGPAPATTPDLPPLPGEEEITAPVSGDEARAPEGAKAGSSGPGAAGATPGDDRHRKLVGIVQQHFKRLGFADEDRDERLWAAGKIANVSDLSSLSDLDPEELSTLADALAKCRDRKRLEEVLAAAGEGGGDA